MIALCTVVATIPLTLPNIHRALRVHKAHK